MDTPPAWLSAHPLKIPLNRRRFYKAPQQNLCVRLSPQIPRQLYTTRSEKLVSEMVDFHHCIPHNEVRGQKVGCDFVLSKSRKYRLDFLFLQWMMGIFSDDSCVPPLFCSSMMRAKVKLSVRVALLFFRAESIFKSNNPAWLANSRRQPWCDQNKLAPPCSERNNIVCLEFNRISWLIYTKPIFFRCGFQGWPVYVLNSFQMKWVTFYSASRPLSDVAATKWIQNVLRAAGIGQRPLWRNSCLTTPRSTREQKVLTACPTRTSRRGVKRVVICCS